MLLSIVCATILTNQSSLEACSRAVCIGEDNIVTVGHSMDWFMEQQIDLWAFPKDMKRDGGIEKQSIKWTSKYGSLIVFSYEGYTAEEMNEKT